MIVGSLCILNDPGARCAQSFHQGDNTYPTLLRKKVGNQSTIPGKAITSPRHIS